MYQYAIPANPTTRDLTPEEKQQVLAGFVKWSGGYKPVDCTTTQRRTYASYARPESLRFAPIMRFLTAELS